MKLVRLSKMCLNVKNSKVHIRKQKGLQQRKCFITTAFQLGLKYANKKVHDNQAALKLHGLSRSCEPTGR
jgi:hypothetical protein